MWHEMIKDFHLDPPGSVDLGQSVFIGDAGGRVAVDGAAGKDHSCVDRDFAANVGIVFHTPEEFFLQEQPRPFMRNFDPSQYIKEQAQGPAPSVSFHRPERPEIILFCGSPGAGKSSFYWKHLQPLAYKRVNQDTLKTREKCVKVATAHLEEGSSIVVDNTNADAETRAVWVRLARKLNLSIRCVLFTASAKVCEHNDTFRALHVGQETNPEKRSLLPRVAFSSFASRYRKPEVSEGLEEIMVVDFQFDGSDEQKKGWSQFWL